MFTWLLLSTDWTEFDATALFERCQDGEWFHVCPHVKAHQLLTSNSHTHTHTPSDSPHPFAYATSTQVKTNTIEPFVSYRKNQRQTEHWLCIGELCFPCKRKIFSATKCFVSIIRNVIHTDVFCWFARHKDNFYSSFCVLVLVVGFAHIYNCVVVVDWLCAHEREKFNCSLFNVHYNEFVLTELCYPISIGSLGFIATKIGSTNSPKWPKIHKNHFLLWMNVVPFQFTITTESLWSCQWSCSLHTFWS